MSTFVEGSIISYRVWTMDLPPILDGYMKSLHSTKCWPADREWLEAKCTISRNIFGVEDGKSHSMESCTCGFYSTNNIAVLSDQIKNLLPIEAQLYHYNEGRSVSYKLKMQNGIIYQKDVESNTERYDNVAPPFVIGAVENKGQIYLGPKGLRAEKCRILGIVAQEGLEVKPEDTDVRICSTFSELKDRFPASDITSLLNDEQMFYSRRNCKTCGGRPARNDDYDRYSPPPCICDDDPPPAKREKDEWSFSRGGHIPTPVNWPLIQASQAAEFRKQVAEINKMFEAPNED